MVLVNGELGAARRQANAGPAGSGAEARVISELLARPERAMPQRREGQARSEVLRATS